MAVIAYIRTCEISTEYLKSTVPRKLDWNLQVFNNREEALNWLILQQS